MQMLMKSYKFKTYSVISIDTSYMAMQGTIKKTEMCNAPLTYRATLNVTLTAPKSD